MQQPDFPDPAQVIRPKELLHVLKAEMAFEDPAFEFLRHGSGLHVAPEDVQAVIAFDSNVCEPMKAVLAIHRVTQIQAFLSVLISQQEAERLCCVMLCFKRQYGPGANPELLLGLDDVDPVSG